MIGDSANPDLLLLLHASTPFATCCTEEYLYTKYNHIVLSLTPSDNVRTCPHSYVSRGRRVQPTGFDGWFICGNAVKAKPTMPYQGPE